MEFHELQTFVAVARYESFVKAAKHLGYSQASVTIHIKNLENELGVQLFDRLAKRTCLTSQGQQFYEKAVIVLNDLQKAKDCISQEEELEGYLNIGTIDSLCASVLPSVLEEYRLMYPKVRINIVTDSPKELLDMLRHNKVDLVYLLDEQVHDTQFTSVVEMEEEVVFAAVKGHSLIDGREHRLRELMRYPFMLTEKNASYRKVLDSELEKQGLQINPIFQSNNTDLLIRMIKDSNAITLLPAYALHHQHGEPKLEPIKVPELTCKVWRQIIYHKDKWVNREMDAFIKINHL